MMTHSKRTGDPSVVARPPAEARGGHGVPPARRMFLFSRVVLLALALLLAACSALPGSPPRQAGPLPPHSHARAARSPQPRAEAQATPAAPLPAVPSPTVPLPVAPTATVQPTPTPQSVWFDAGDVEVFPQPVYSGDQVSFRVTLHNGSTRPADRIPVQLYLGDGKTGSHPLGGPVQSGRLAPGGTAQVVFQWVWNTSGVSGLQTISVAAGGNGAARTSAPTAQPDVVALSLSILPASARPPVDASAHWATARSQCCVFNYITGTPAERDLAWLENQADTSLAYVQRRLGVTLDKPLQVYLANRVIGHGGFAAGWILLSYLDRDYAAGNMDQLFRHEGTHAVERRWAGRGEGILMMSEGLAVFVAGGHFKPEPLMERAAALLAIGRYIPLVDLAPDFYGEQHDIGYLEAGAFVQYLADRYGMDRLRQLYGSYQRQGNWSDTQVLDHALQTVYGRSLSDLESDWLAELRRLAPNPDQQRDLQLTIDYYDTVRRYQKELDPGAYFRQAWLPDAAEAERRGIVADYLRNPRAPANVTLETMLIAAHDALLAGDFDQSERLLASVNAVLAANARFDDPIAADYLAVVRTAITAGYQVERVWLEGNGATVLVHTGSGSRQELEMSRTPVGWMILNRT